MIGPSTPRAVSERVVVLALGAVVLLVAILTITPWPVGAFQDDAMYTVLAKSLATGEGFRMLNLPGAPNATHYPPGYPLVLAALWKLWPSFPDNIVLFKFANAFFLAAAAIGAYRFTRTRFRCTIAEAAATALVGTLSIVVLLITGVVLSEPLFMALLFPALMAAERAADDGAVRTAVIAGLLIGALAMVRTLGAFAVPAACLVLAARRHWRAAFALGASAALFLVPWQLWVSAHQHEIAHPLVGKYGSYGGWLAQGYAAGGWSFARDVVAKNWADLYGTMSYVVLPVVASPPRAVGWAALLLFVAVGTRRYWRDARVTLAFLTVYMLVVMVWPFEPNRFVIALWPLWIPLIAFGVAACWRAPLVGAARHAWHAAVATCALTLVAGNLWYNGTGYTRRWWASIQRNAGVEAKPTVQWVARYTAPNDVISASHELLVYLYTGRRTVPTSTFTPGERLRWLTDAEDRAAVVEILDAYKPSYYIASGPQGVRTAAALATANPPVLRAIGHTPSALFYQVIPR